MRDSAGGPGWHVVQGSCLTIARVMREAAKWNAPLNPARLLVEAGVEVFCPMETMRVMRGAKRRERSLPLFGIYCFARFDPLAFNWRGLMAIKGVEGLICQGAGEAQRPFRMPDGYVELLVEHGPWSADDLGRAARGLRARRRLGRGDTVRVSDGPMMGALALIERIDKQGRARVWMAAMGGLAATIIDSGRLELVSVSAVPPASASQGHRQAA